MRLLERAPEWKRRREAGETLEAIARTHEKNHPEDAPVTRERVRQVIFRYYDLGERPPKEVDWEAAAMHHEGGQ